jgi:hypothetical protein
MYEVTTYSGTVHLFDTENKLHMRNSTRDLGLRADGQWSAYTDLGVANTPEGDCLLVRYTNGEWLATSLVRSVKLDGVETDFIVLGPAFLAGVNEKHDAIQVRKYSRNA